MQSKNNALIDFSDNLGKLINSKLDLSKLELIDVVSRIGSSMIALLIIGISFLFFMLFSSIGAVIYISKYCDNYLIGFLAVAGFYLLIAIILLTGKKTLLATPLRNKIIRILFSV